MVIVSDRPYSDAFYAEQGSGSAESAACIVPILMDQFAPKSVVDVGCGVGGWLAEFRKRGVLDATGIDGEWVSLDQLLIPTQSFVPANLTEPVLLDRAFDMCLCLEVAEHLSEVYADQLIGSLVSLAPVVVFSAAVPGQSGVNHVNEQWQSYWAAKFEAHSFTLLDCVRPVVWSEPKVQWWYAQNLLVYTHEDLLAARPGLALLARERRAAIIDVVHPSMFAFFAAGLQVDRPRAVDSDPRCLPDTQARPSSCATYPTKLAVAERLTATHQAEVTVAIPTLGRLETVVEALGSVVSQESARPFEILVLDNGCSDELARRVHVVAETSPVRVEYVPVPAIGLHSGRHEAARRAAGEIVAYLDDDVIVQPGWLEAIERTFHDPGVCLAGGRCLPLYESETPAWLDAFWDTEEDGTRFCAALSLIDPGETPASTSTPSHLWGELRRAETGAFKSWRVPPRRAALGTAPIPRRWRVRSRPRCPTSRSSLRVQPGRDGPAPSAILANDGRVLPTTRLPWWHLAIIHRGS